MKKQKRLFKKGVGQINKKKTNLDHYLLKDIFQIFIFENDCFKTIIIF